MTRLRWLAAAPLLALSCALAAAYMGFRAAAEALLGLPDDLEDVLSARTCINDDNDTAPGEDLCSSCLDTEQAGEPLLNQYRHDRRGSTR